MKKIVVSNAIGQSIELFNISNNEVDLSTFESGMYFLSITTIDGIIYHSKCIKE